MTKNKPSHGKVVGDEDNNRFVILIEDDSISLRFLTLLWQESTASFDIKDDGSHYILIPKENLVDLLYTLKKNGLLISISPSLLVGNLVMAVPHGIPYIRKKKLSTKRVGAILVEPEIFQMSCSANLPEYLEDIYIA